MHKILKFNTEPGRNIFISSDWHINHNKGFIFGTRGFQSIEAHDAWLLENINLKIEANDILFNLGDMFLNSTEESANAFLDKIKCQNIYYIWGNHESVPWKLYLQAKQQQYPDVEAEIYPVKYKNVTFLGDYQEISINKQHFVLCHYPLSVWNGHTINSICLCGHSHGSFVNSRPETTNKGKIIDVGIDLFPDFVDFGEIMEIAKLKSFEKVDHHG